MSRALYTAQQRRANYFPQGVAVFKGTSHYQASKKLTCFHLTYACGTKRIYPHIINPGSVIPREEGIAVLWVKGIRARDSVWTRQHEGSLLSNRVSKRDSLLFCPHTVPIPSELFWFPSMKRNLQKFESRA